MKIKLHHAENFGHFVDICLNVSTKDDGNYFEKLFHLTEENERHLVIQAKKEKSQDNTYPNPAFIEGIICDENGVVCVVPNRMFHEDDLNAIDDWIYSHEQEWVGSLEA